MSTVIITGAAHPTALGTARALYGAGHRLVGICGDRDAACCRSRVWDELIETGGAPVAELDALSRAGRTHPGALLLPTTDASVQMISENRERLGERLTIVLPSRETVDLLLDKTAFHSWALARGFPVPESLAVDCRESLERALARIGTPAVIKPLFRTAQWESYSPDRKVLRVDDPADVDRIPFDLFRAAPRFLVQQWVHGPDHDIFFCLSYYDRGGHEVAWYTGRKILQWPPGTGSTAICEGVVNEEVHELAHSVFEAAGMRGLGSLEVKLDRTRGRYVIVEPTVGRNNLQSYVSVAGGVNLSRVAALDAFGVPLHQAFVTRTHAVWLKEPFALRAVVTALLRGALPLSELRRAFAGGTRIACAYYQRHDSAPLRRRIKEVVRRRLRYGSQFARVHAARVK